jgi:hypothetical protein
MEDLSRGNLKKGKFFLGEDEDGVRKCMGWSLGGWGFFLIFYFFNFFISGGREIT